MTTAISSILIEVIRTVLFFYERYFKCKKHKQKDLKTLNQIFLSKKKHKQKNLSNIQPDISKQKSTYTTFIETIYTNKYVLKHLKKASLKTSRAKITC